MHVVLPGLLRLRAVLMAALAVLFAPWNAALANELPYREIVECADAPESERDIECGYVYSALVPGNPSAGTMKFPYQIHRSRSEDRRDEPVIYVQGGPGAYSFANANYAADWAETLVLPDYDWVENRDIIIFSQRGTSDTQPALVCDDFPPAFLSPATLNVDQVQDPNPRYMEFFSRTKNLQETTYDLWRHSRCVDQIRANGIDPSHFSTREIIEDIKAMIQTLELETPILWGASYGTWITLTFMEKYPDAISAAILTGVYPPGIAENMSWPVEFLKLLGKLEAICRKPGQCPGTEDDLFSDFLDRLRWLAPLVTDDSDPARAFDNRFYAEIVWYAFYSQDGLQRLPSLMRMDDEAIDQATTDWFDIFATVQVPANMATSCHDARWKSSITGVGRISELQPLLEWFDQVDLAMEQGCDLWRGDGFEPPERDLPISSDLPTLMMTGSWDVVTPIQLMYNQRVFLPNSWTFGMRGVSHTVIDNPCAQTIMSNFLRDPTTDPRDDCVDALTDPDFR